MTKWHDSDFKYRRSLCINKEEGDTGCIVDIYLGSDDRIGKIYSAERSWDFDKGRLKVVIPVDISYGEKVWLYYDFPDEEEIEIVIKENKQEKVTSFVWPSDGSGIILEWKA